MAVLLYFNYLVHIVSALPSPQAGPGDGSRPTTSDWAEALAAGLAAVQKYGRADRGCRTMLDALLPARDALLEAVANGGRGAMGRVGAMCVSVPAKCRTIAKLPGTYAPGKQFTPRLPLNDFCAGADGSTAAEAAAAAAEEGAAATRGMAAAAGRASYVPAEVLAATADPGAMAAAVWLRAVAGAVRAG